MKFLILFFLSFPVFAGSIQVKWIAPSEREDLSPLALSEIASYNIYYNTDGSTLYPNVINVLDPTATTHTIESLPPATYNLVLEVEDTGGRVSFYSTILTRTILEPVISPPKPVTGWDASALP